MHEYGLAEQAFHSALEQARRAGARKIKELQFFISAGSHISEESMQMHLESLSRGTLAEGAALRFRVELTKVRCFDCGELFSSTTQGSSIVCPCCGGTGLPLPAEREFGLESIEIE